MKPMSGKIDRGCLPNLSHLLADAEPEVENNWSGSPTGTAGHGGGEGQPARHRCGRGTGLSEEVLAICRAVFETSLGWDDVFADHGGHSIVIARLAERLRAAGWAVPVRALLSDCDTARKVANRPTRAPAGLSRPLRLARNPTDDSHRAR